MRTTFTFEDDKELVQLARTYVDAGTRKSWAGVAQECGARVTMPESNSNDCMMIAELVKLSKLGGSDVVLDIGAGVGHVVAQVALGTNVHKTIDIEFHSDVYDLGVKMMSKSAHSRRLRDRAQLVCQAAADINVSITPPYADSTIVFWNNVLFEQRVVEFVKEELSGMFLLRMLLSSLTSCSDTVICANTRSADRSS
ncbi:hypothetical protein PHMEG_00012084 [Phytophthora megakarya]|uniref:DOT1 domain-containing protein n=1 Tax=Phytophthora megakarya TaxID=4795 RepID=A0A225WA54_9STRA|nr:hypothetical protein PHMEG_00012084 [Phytophthora megakarya]